ncbi:MAG TPA: IS256 family transposase [Vicinamibacterales bacterium]|nr:IS256 family transposase [Vicinamibacterales bacterium]
MRRRRKNLTPDTPLTPVPDEILDYFVRQGPISPEELDAAVRKFKKAIIERALGGELTHHLGYPPGGEKPDDTTNHRNGTGSKTVLTDDGPLRIDVPRDRDGSFEPRLIGKHERRFTGFDDKILALYARGMTVHEIQGFLAEMYGVEVSPDLISTVTDGIVAEVAAWQSRPLERMYPVVFFDALRVKIRDEATVRSKAIYLALAVLPDGHREILGLWIEQTEGAKFWMKVFSDLKTRGCQDILIAVTDGLKGMSEALAAVFPQTTLQTCIVHVIRHSLDFANWKERKPMATALRPIYTAPTGEAASAALDAFERGPWGKKFPTVVASWRRAWTHIIPFFAFPPDIRRLIYTTNSLESVHAQLRKIIKTRGHFPTDEAATKLIWLALRNITAKWERTSYYWRAAMTQFAILYEDRFSPTTA